MIHIKCRDDAFKVPKEFRKKILDDFGELIDMYDNPPFNPEADGYFIFFENDKDSVLDFPYLNREDGGLYSRPWESVAYFPKLHMYSIVFLRDNQFAITAYFDAVNLDPELRKLFDEERESAQPFTI